MNKNARAGIRARPDIEAVLRQALVPQMVAPNLRWKLSRLPALQQKHALAGFG